MPGPDIEQSGHRIIVKLLMERAETDRTHVYHPLPLAGHAGNAANALFTFSKKSAPLQGGR
jgi:hypothetical protein